MRCLVILGAGGYGRTVADVARQSGRYDSVLFLDDHAVGENIMGPCADYTNFSAYNDFNGMVTEMYPAFGDNKSRLVWLDKLKEAGLPVATIVHPTAYVSPTAQVGVGCVILPGAIVNTACRVERGCIVNCGAIVDHGCVLEEGVHVCLGAIVKAENRIPAGMKIEAGQVVENRTYPL